MGMSATFGEFGGMPLVVALFWARIDNKLICFFEQVSMVTHSDMLRKWLSKTFKCPVTNATNFHNAVQ